MSWELNTAVRCYHGPLSNSSIIKKVGLSHTSGAKGQEVIAMIGEAPAIITLT